MTVMAGHKPSPHPVAGWIVADIRAVGEVLLGRSVAFTRFDAWIRTSLAFGPLRVALQRWRALRIRMETCSVCHSAHYESLQCEVSPRLRVPGSRSPRRRSRNRRTTNIDSARRGLGQRGEFLGKVNKRSPGGVLTVELVLFGRTGCQGKRRCCQSQTPKC